MEISVTITATGTTTSFKQSQLQHALTYIESLVGDRIKFTVVYS